MYSTNLGQPVPPVPDVPAAAVAATAAVTAAVPTGAVPTGVRRGLLRDLVALARPAQWPKNLLVVPLALIDAPGIGLGALARMGLAVVLFTLLSAFVYVWNDIADRHRDRLHPVKRNRPIAAGRVGVGPARAYALGLVVLVAVLLAVGPAMSWWPLFGYLALNLSYVRWLKHLPLLDVFAVAAGFVLRVVQGYLAVPARASVWLLACVFTLCLLLAAGKRRHEMAVGGSAHRPSLAGYTTQYLDYLIILYATLTVTVFLLYLVNGGFAAPYTDASLLVSLPCAIFAVARHLHVVVVGKGGGDPVRLLLRDRAMVVNTLVWAGGLAVILVAARFPVLVEFAGQLLEGR
ncbi:UbiA prenyltransferase family protein [Polymorphospora rubra]|uniref:Decaprenyl-phosphate phosphoribosyltransferase n=1 Tax=Polymorphospora rubra TaxID=338584 RepID=A0A810NBF3_9ACTN|nr:UbiA prenyltransferase family protein [Polymorphospora rubra]BCJ68665.1 decaprenyl-phosphate phosphoribosyltransferase [Polymorphospora rubra]